MRTVLLAILLGLTWSASNTVESRRPGASAVQESIPDDLQQLTNILQRTVDETIVSKKGAKLARQLEEMRIPDQLIWFTTTFGRENGGLLSSVYSQTAEDEDSQITQYFVAHAQHGGRVTASVAFGGSSPPRNAYQQAFDDAIRQSLKVPAQFYSVQYVWDSEKSASPGTYSLGYVTLAGGKYRLIGEAVLRAVPGTPAMRIRLGGAVAAQGLVTKVQPVYPSDARAQHVSGTVRLHAVIGTDGAIKKLEAVSGEALLTPAALDAVKQWRYRPTTINGEKVEVDTVIDVVFSLNP